MNLQTTNLFIDFTDKNIFFLQWFLSGGANTYRCPGITWVSHVTCFINLIYDLSITAYPNCSCLIIISFPHLQRNSRFHQWLLKSLLLLSVSCLLWVWKVEKFNQKFSAIHSPVRIWKFKGGTTLFLWWFFFNFDIGFLMHHSYLCSSVWLVVLFIRFELS